MTAAPVRRAPNGMLSEAGITEPVRWRLVAIASVGSTLLLVYALAQTALGRARFDVVPATAAALVMALAGFAAPLMTIEWSWLRGRGSALHHR